jgi:hypothetical protein
MFISQNFNLLAEAMLPSGEPASNSAIKQAVVSFKLGNHFCPA